MSKHSFLCHYILAIKVDRTEKWATLTWCAALFVLLFTQHRTFGLIRDRLPIISFGRPVRGSFARCGDKALGAGAADAGKFGNPLTLVSQGGG